MLSPSEKSEVRLTKTDFTGEIIFTELGSMAPIWKNMVEAGKTQVWIEDLVGKKGRRDNGNISDSLLRGLQCSGEDR